MRKFIFIVAILILAITISGNKENKEIYKNINGEIYYVDHSILRLIPVDVNLGYTSKEKAAKIIINKLIEGQDNNKKILRVIPDIKNCMDVKVEKNTAYVNLKKEFTKNKTNNHIHEQLMIYSIVNSLTSIEGIDTVQFLFDGKVLKKYFAGIDMREFFIPDYYV